MTTRCRQKILRLKSEEGSKHLAEQLNKKYIGIRGLLTHAGNNFFHRRVLVHPSRRSQMPAVYENLNTLIGPGWLRSWKPRRGWLNFKIWEHIPFGNCCSLWCLSPTNVWDISLVRYPKQFKDCSVGQVGALSNFNALFRAVWDGLFFTWKSRLYLLWTSMKEPFQLCRFSRHCCIIGELIIIM